MNESEWLYSGKPGRMLNGVRGRISARKHRLFLLACMQRIAAILIPEHLRMVVAYEEWAIGVGSNPVAGKWGVCPLDSSEGIRHYRDLATQAVFEIIDDRDDPSVLEALARAEVEAPAFDWPEQGRRDYRLVPEVESALFEQAELLREVAGNPFRPVNFASEWRTSTVLGVAEAIYADRAFGNLPVLADALEDAGCDHADILSHCRGPGPHVRGCWVVDLVLGKE